jgi:hypothetical protein
VLIAAFAMQDQAGGIAGTNGFSVFSIDGAVPGSFEFAHILRRPMHCIASIFFACWHAGSVVRGYRKRFPTRPSDLIQE